MNIKIYIIILLALWRVTHLISYEDGPFKVFLKLRKKTGKPFDCFYCLSIWIGFMTSLYFSQSIEEIILFSLSLSGGAILLEKITNKY
jgi:hypothetical protein